MLLNGDEEYLAAATGEQLTISRESSAMHGNFVFVRIEKQN